MKLAVFGTLATTFIFGLRHFPAFYLLCLLTSVPRYLYGALSGRSLEDQLVTPATWGDDLLTAVEVLLAGLVTAVMVWTLIRDQGGERWTVLPAFQDVFEHLPMILGVGGCVALVSMLLSVMFDLALALAPLAIIAPALLIAVLALVFAVLLPCAAVSESGILECFTESAELTAGSRLRILMLYVLVSVPLVIVSFLALVILQPDARTGLPAEWAFLGMAALNVFLYATPVAIHNALAEPDGGDVLAETAAVFD